MAKKMQENSKKSNSRSSASDNPRSQTSLGQRIKDDTKNGIFAVISFVFALFFMLSAFAKAGIAGDFFFEIFSYLFGIGYYLLPIISILLGISFLRAEQPHVGLWHAISANLILFSSLGIIDIFQKG